MRILRIMLLCIWSSAVLTPMNGAAAEGQSFIDRFASLDEHRWYISDGWSNGAYQNCTWQQRNVHLSKNGLELKLSDAPSKERLYTCAEIQTVDLYGYGTYEVRMRPAVGPGLVSAFFTFIGPQLNPKYPWDEIDFEFLGKNPNAVELNFFSNGEKAGHGYIAQFEFNAVAAMNNFAVEWLPDSIRWFINGKLVYQYHARVGERLPTQPSKIYLSIWNGSGETMEPWLGKFFYPGHPLVASYEYVAFTKAGDICQFPESIVCSGVPIKRTDGRMPPYRHP